MQLFGFQVLTVLSGSMNPTYPTGSVVYVKEVDTEDLGVGDVITYRISDKTLVTHRIVRLETDPDNPDQLMFRTKGDNNDDEDGLVHPSAVVGKVYFGIPLLGYIAHVMQLPFGKFIAIAVCVFVVLLTFIPDILWGKEKTSDKEAKK